MLLPWLHCINSELNTHCSLAVCHAQVKEALDKVKDAINFMTRGLKLLGSDISTAARLFGKAAMGKRIQSAGARFFFVAVVTLHCVAGRSDGGVGRVLKLALLSALCMLSLRGWRQRENRLWLHVLLYTSIPT
jgi:hypothetical protein